MNKRLIFPLLFLFSGAVLAGNESRVLDLKECLSLALDQSGAARAAAIDESIAGSKVRQARSIALPHFSANATYTRLDELQEVQLDGEPLKLGTLDNYSMQAEVSQLLFSGGKVSAALRASDLTKRYAKSVRAETESEIVKDTTELFNNILLARERVEVIEESVELLKELVDQTKQKRAVGKAADFDVLTATVRWMNEKPQLISARNDLAVLNEQMRRMLGFDNEQFRIDGNLRPSKAAPDYELLAKLAVEQRPLLHSLEDMTLLRGEDVVSARSDMLPNLSAFANYSGANSYGFVSFGEDEWEWHWNAGLALTWNLWDGHFSRSVLQENRLEHLKSQVIYDDAKKEVLVALKQAVLKMEHATETVEATQENVKLAEKAMEIASVRHEAGMSTYLDYTDANIALKRARLGYFAAVASQLNAIANLEFTVGKRNLLDADHKRETGDRNE